MRRDSKGFSGVRESFLRENLNKQEQEIRTGDDNGILGSHYVNTSIGLLLITQP